MADREQHQRSSRKGLARRDAVLLSLLGLLVVAALLAVFAFELSNTQAKSKADVKTRVHERTVLAAALIDSLLQTVGQQVAIYSKTYGGREVPATTMNAERRQSKYLVLLDDAGKVLATSAGLTAQARRQLPRSAALTAVRSGRPYAVGNVAPYGRAGVIDLAVAFPTRYGKRILVTGVDPAGISLLVGGELSKIPGVEGAHNYLIDGNNTVLGSTNPDIQFGHVFGTPLQVKALASRSGEVAGRYYDQAGISGTPWKVVLAAPDGPLFASVSGLRKWVPWAIFAAFALFAIAALLLARRLIRRSDEVRGANKQLAALNAELAVTNARLERRAAELARSNEELEQFASIASHDLQEPLRKVRTFTQRVEVLEADQLSDKGRDYLQRANAAAERMQQLIEDLLRLSRVSTQARPFTKVDLSAVTREVLDDLEAEIQDSGATVTVGDLPAITGDALQLRQLMQNLISNALKFRRDGVAPEIEIDASSAGELATITVHDNGIGFEEQYRRRIFRVFERLHGRGRYPGTGIGLALCRKIADRHGGTITAESVPGMGSTFTVTLPLDHRDEAIAPDDRGGTASAETPVLA